MNPLSRFLAGISAVTLLAACQGGPDTAIQRVDYFHLKALQTERTDNPMINHQPRQFLHGAISQEERRARLGNYYTVRWAVDDRSLPVTLRFEYRQANVGSEVREQTVTINQISRTNKTEFQVTGDDYLSDGRVLAWRLSLEQDGVILGQESSFLWN